MSWNIYWAVFAAILVAGFIAEILGSGTTSSRGRRLGACLLGVMVNGLDPANA